MLKPRVNWVPYVDSNTLCGLPADYDNSSYGDAMLSSCAVIDFEKGVGESTADTDFLKDLGMLWFYPRTCIYINISNCLCKIM